MTTNNSKKRATVELPIETANMLNELLSANDTILPAMNAVTMSKYLSAIGKLQHEISVANGKEKSRTENTKDEQSGT